MKKIKKTKKIKKETKSTKVKKKIKITPSIILHGILVAGIIVATTVLVFALYIIITAPNFDKDLLYQKEATIIYDVNGNEMMRTGVDNIDLVTYDELPQVLIDAIVATEDSRFFQHTGLDVPRFIVASVGQVFGNDDAGGASTLSMQVIKNTYTTNVASGIDGIIRKFTDVYMSIFKLENAYTKEEIFEFYVNSQWLGHDSNVNYTGITGVEQGSKYFFGKSVSELTLAEATIIAGLFQSPVSLNPYNYPEEARDRQEIVLTLMVRHGYISEEEKEAVLAIPIESLLKEQENSTSNYLQASVDYILEEAKDRTGQDPYLVPMEIYTTIDMDVQKILHGVETGEYYEIPESYGDLQFGMAITDMENGGITALSGGIDYQAKDLLNRSIIRRQPGSTAKPLFDYGPHIEYLNSSPETYFLDEATTYTGGTSIRNWDNQYWGLMTMRDALVTSRNIPALLAFQEVAEVDLSYIEEFVHNLGIDYGANLYESASIGGFDGVSPLELSAAYAAFGREGYYIEPYSITEITFVDADITEEYKYTKTKAMSTETAYLVNDMLLSAGVGYVAGFSVPGTDIGTKTGTSTIDADAAEELGIPSWAINDNWVVSYSPEYSFATWLGYDILSSDYYLTSALANPVRNGLSSAVGSRLYSHNQQFTWSASVVNVEVEKETIPLMLASEHTPEDMITSALFKKGTEPTDVSPRYEELEDITKLTAVFDGSKIKLSWDEISSPIGTDEEYLTEYFNENYGDYASKYYEARLSYNEDSIGTLGYDIYLDTNGTLTKIGTSKTNSFDYTVPTLGEDYTFVVKSAYSIFKANSSEGKSIEVETTIDTNTGDIVDDNNNSNNELPETSDDAVNP